MKSYILSPEANVDIWSIYEYIAEDSPDRAIKFIKILKENCSLIVTTLKIGRERIDLKRGLYSFSVGDYIIFYCIADRSIEIIRILHGSRDLPNYFE